MFVMEGCVVGGCRRVGGGWGSVWCWVMGVAMDVDASQGREERFGGRRACGPTAMEDARSGA
jgi:hypothetical protein